MVELDRERLAGAVRIKRQAASPGILAAALGISRATLARIERGQHEVSTSAFLNVCRWLGRNPMDFARPKETPPPGSQIVTEPSRAVTPRHEVSGDERA